MNYLSDKSYTIYCALIQTVNPKVVAALHTRTSYFIGEMLLQKVTVNISEMLIERLIDKLTIMPLQNSGYTGLQSQFFTFSESTEGPYNVVPNKKWKVSILCSVSSSLTIWFQDFESVQDVMEAVMNL